MPNVNLISGESLAILKQDSISSVASVLGISFLRDEYGSPVDWMNTQNEVINKLIEQIQARDVLIRNVKTTLPIDENAYQQLNLIAFNIQSES